MEYTTANTDEDDASVVDAASSSDDDDGDGDNNGYEEPAACSSNSTCGTDYRHSISNCAAIVKVVDGRLHTTFVPASPPLGNALFNGNNRKCEMPIARLVIPAGHHHLQHPHHFNFHHHQQQQQQNYRQSSLFDLTPEMMIRGAEALPPNSIAAAAAGSGSGGGGGGGGGGEATFPHSATTNSACSPLLIGGGGGGGSSSSGGGASYACGSLLPLRRNAPPNHRPPAPPNCPPPKRRPQLNNGNNIINQRQRSRQHKKCSFFAGCCKRLGKWPAVALLSLFAISATVLCCLLIWLALLHGSQNRPAASTSSQNAAELPSSASPLSNNNQNNNHYKISLFPSVSTSLDDAQNNPPHPSSSGAFSTSTHQNQNLPLLHPHPQQQQFLPLLPTLLPLNQPTAFHLPSHHLLFTRLNLEKDGSLEMNITLGSSSRIVLLARHSLRPTIGQHDWQRVLAGENLHLDVVLGAEKIREKKGGGGRKRRLAIVSHFLQAGRWHFGFLNDRGESEQLELVASLKEQAATNTKSNMHDPNNKNISNKCLFDCFSKGQCRDGRCVCHPGYGGLFCEETACPVLCSGQGVFSGGRCLCHEGFRGAECEHPVGWCDEKECGKNGGKCQPDGSCLCLPGWTGELCEQQQKHTKENFEQTCAGGCSGPHGICHPQEHRCFCAPGRTGDRCELKIGGNVDGELLERSGRGGGGKGEVEKGEGNGKMEQQQNLEDLKMKSDKKNVESGDCVFGCGEHGQCRFEGEEEEGEGNSSSNGGGEEGGGKGKGKQSPRCECSAGWTGLNCQIELCPKNCSSPSGLCALSAEGWRCECDAFHFGEHCQFRVESDCDDGVDNDEDGLTDCEDSTECCSHHSCSANALCLVSSLLTRELLLEQQEKQQQQQEQKNNNKNDKNKFFESVRFLFDGGDLSVQRYADVRLLDPERLSVLLGRLLSTLGGPLVGVRVSAADHPQQGFSLSRAKAAGVVAAAAATADFSAAGEFELVVNGGTDVTLQFVRQPYGRVLRTFYVPANQILDVGNVWMDNKSNNESYGS